MAYSLDADDIHEMVYWFIFTLADLKLIEYNTYLNADVDIPRLMKLRNEDV